MMFDFFFPFSPAQVISPDARVSTLTNKLPSFPYRFCPDR